MAGLYGYMVGTVSGALGTSSAFIAVQGTGAMAMLIADVGALRESGDPTRALVTLSILTGTRAGLEFVQVRRYLLRSVAEHGVRFQPLACPCVQETVRRASVMR